MNSKFDVIVIGGGPAGYTAAMYTARAGLSTLIIEKMAAGGQMTQTTHIDNYPGFPQGIDGYTLGMQMQAGAERFGVQTRYGTVQSVQLEGSPKTVVTADGTFYARSVIIATGADHRHLGLEKETQLIGKGISYCAACDGMFFQGKTVAVVGGGNSAAADALVLSRLAKKVILIHRRDTLRATKIYHQSLMQAENVEFLWNSTVTELHHEDRLNAITVANTVTGEESMLSVDGLFISIGQNPATELFRDQLELDETGYIVAGESTETSLPGVFAAGDVRTKLLRQIVTATADGAQAAYGAEHYLTQ